MTEIQLKGLLNNFNIMQQQLVILSRCPKDYGSEAIRIKYDRTSFCVNVITSAIGILNERERFIIDVHLIDQRTWGDTTEKFENQYGIANSRSERTLKRIQSQAIQKLLKFINDLPIDFDITV